MIQCARCRAALSAGSMACPACGEKFPAPVPAEAPLSAPQVLVPSPAPQASSPGRRRSFLLWVAGGLGAAALLIVGLAFLGYRSLENSLSRTLGVQEAPAGHQGSWTPRSRLTAQLAPAFQVAGPLGLYTVQPPAGYTLRLAKMDAADGKSVIYTWTGPMTSDRTAPQFVLSFGSDGGTITSHLSSAQDVAIGFQSLRRDHTRIVLSSIQNGSINGLAFSRGYWKGIGLRTGRRFHGLMYCQIESPNLINIAAKDSEPSSRSSLPVFDAAALSLRLVKRM